MIFEECGRLRNVGIFYNDNVSTLTGFQILSGFSFPD